MKISAEEREIIEQTLEHSAAGTTHTLPEVMYNPTSNYVSAEKLKQEIDILFRNFPIILAHASELSQPGDFLVNDDTGVPILTTRDKDGEVKAFLNVCRHRGARLKNDSCGHTRVFTCPYHGWTYELNGKLRGQPQPQGFSACDKSELGLVEVPVFEQFGMIWIVPSARKKNVDFDAWVKPMAEQLSGLAIEKHVVYKQWSLERKMSWRLALEGFQESYHFCHAHKNTACSSYLDNKSVHLNYYPHVRHAVPLTKVEELRDQEPENWQYRPYYMTQNYLFPANFVQVMTDHIYVHTIIPTGADSCIFKCMMLIPEAPSSEKAEKYWQKNYKIIRVVFDEDFVIGEGIQKGLNSGANSNFVFGNYECGLHFGQNAIDDALAGRLTV